MTKHDDQLAALVSPALSSGEQLVATSQVEYNGTIAPNNATIDAALAALGERPDRPAGGPDPDALVAFPSAPLMALALTTRRLLVVGVGISGKPKQVLGVVPLSAVASVSGHEGGFGLQMRVTMKSGALVDLEHRKTHDGAAFTRQFADLLARVAEAKGVQDLHGNGGPPPDGAPPA